MAYFVPFCRAVFCRAVQGDTAAAAASLDFFSSAFSETNLSLCCTCRWLHRLLVVNAAALTPPRDIDWLHRVQSGWISLWPIYGILVKYGPYDGLPLRRTKQRPLRHDNSFTPITDCMVWTTQQPLNVKAWATLWNVILWRLVCQCGSCNIKLAFVRRGMYLQRDTVLRLLHRLPGDGWAGWILDYTVHAGYVTRACLHLLDVCYE